MILQVQHFSWYDGWNTTQSYKDYDKPLEGSLLTNQDDSWNIMSWNYQTSVFGGCLDVSPKDPDLEKIFRANQQGPAFLAVCTKASHMVKTQ